MEGTRVLFLLVDRLVPKAKALTEEGDKDIFAFDFFSAYWLLLGRMLLFIRRSEMWMLLGFFSRFHRKVSPWKRIPSSRSLSQNRYFWKIRQQARAISRNISRDCNQSPSKTKVRFFLGGGAENLHSFSIGGLIPFGLLWGSGAELFV